MDFYAETEQRKQQLLGEIGDLSYQRYLACKAIEDNEKLILEVDAEIARREAAVREADRAQRNFNTYLAVKEGALTTDDLAQAIQDGGQVVDGEKADEKQKKAKGGRPGSSGPD